MSEARRPTEANDSSNRAGRKRSEESHRAILEASIAVLDERGFVDASIEAIAARAGVGK